MATLSDPDRQTIFAGFMRDRSAVQDALPLSKADLLAAVNGLDDFLNTNAGSINTAIPAAARSALTTPQKALLLQYVIQRRYIAGA